MKKIITIALVLGLAGPAFGNWVQDFGMTYRKRGIDVAVKKAIQEGNAPIAIVKEAMTFKRLNPQQIVKALYCAGANGQDIMAAAEENGISEMMVTAGYESSVAVCSDKVADAKPYGGNAVRRGPVEITPPDGGRGRPFVSPSQP